MNSPKILYCHCQYAQVLPEAVKKGTLERLCQSGQPFESVADLCEMSARRDPALQRLAAAGPVKIAACFPRAVKWLFAAAGTPLATADTEVVNLRVLSVEAAATALLTSPLAPNLPEGKITAASESVAGSNSTSS